MRLRYFFIALILSLPFSWGANVLALRMEEVFYSREIAENPGILAAQMNQKLLEAKVENLKPFRSRQSEDLKIEAEAAISIFFDPTQGKKKILFEKETNKKLPIASLTKLMTADIVLENYDLSQEIEISKAAVSQESEFGNLKIGEKFLVKDLMYPLLMESSNDAAYGLAELYPARIGYAEGIAGGGVESFVELMNLKAQDLGLFDTSFMNPTGLDPDSLNELGNYSTVQDLAKLIENLLLEKPLIWEILSTSQFNLYSPDGVFHHKLLNTNELLRQDGWANNIIGGKTGWTPKAKGCLVLVIKAPNSNSYVINVILGSEDRFGAMKKMIEWINTAYKW